MKQKLQAYRHADTMGKSPLDLILMVYDGAIRALRAAGERFRKQENQGGFEEMEKAKRLVTHLYTTLNFKTGGQIAANLGKVYSWSIAQIQLIEATRDVEQIDNVIRALNNLRSGWAELKVSRANIRKTETAGPDEETSDAGSVHVLTRA